MLQEERYQRIRALLASFTRLSAERIAKDLGVSRETTRRDLVALEALGELRRIHGGVVLNQPEAEPPFERRLKSHHREKRAIAKAAVRLLKSGHTVFLDAGSTTLIMTEELVSLSGLTVLTNGLEIATRMAAAGGAERGNRVIVLGGELMRGVPATCGAATVAEIGRYRADLALLSPVAVHPSEGASDFDLDEAAVAQAMCDAAERRIILADHSKIGMRSRRCFCPAKRIDVLVTNQAARKHPEFAGFADTGIEVVLA
ncbi:alkaline phosphatase [Parazoarcus communis]|jgi:DeoR/GlpR family transcriptional regulator of sugar metabolism|uniref:Alkaline phosphatase n=1 Tax=Parazoarcus communis TaxID=41977 RepID=A0A2U8GZ47_9RHOO|nr:DeoR/GlpR family DNA-binding transcription regulator [Parazoarcus communis]AWI78748.1 alkaline phosphatase [Parazoarcus communis]